MGILPMSGPGRPCSVRNAPERRAREETVRRASERRCVAAVPPAVAPRAPLECGSYDDARGAETVRSHSLSRKGAARFCNNRSPAGENGTRQRAGINLLVVENFS